MVLTHMLFVWTYFSVLIWKINKSSTVSFTSDGHWATKTEQTTDIMTKVNFAWNAYYILLYVLYINVA